MWAQEALKLWSLGRVERKFVEKVAKEDDFGLDAFGHFCGLEMLELMEIWPDGLLEMHLYLVGVSFLHLSNPSYYKSIREPYHVDKEPTVQLQGAVSIQSAAARWKLG